MDIIRLDNFIKIINEQIDYYEKRYKENNVALYSSAISLLENLNSLVEKMKSAQCEGFTSPFSEMMISSLEGFVELFDYARESDEEQALEALGIYTTEMYYAYRSSMCGIIEPLMLNGVDLFRDVPEVLVAEYYNLIDSISFIIRNEYDLDAPSKFYYLLAPSLTPSVMTNKLFCSPEYDKRLLLISFPRNMLYQPKVLIASLVHEVAHYSGGYERLRKDRLNTIFDLLAYFIVYQTGEKVTDDSYEFMKQLLFRSNDSIAQQNDEVNAELLDSLIPSSRHAFYKIFNLKSLSDWDKISNKSSYIDSNHSYLDSLFTSLENGLVDDLLVFINCLVDIFSEVYADIVAVSLLNMQLTDYLYMLKQNGASFERFTVLMERIQIVASTCWGGGTQVHLQECPSWMIQTEYENIVNWPNLILPDVFPNSIRCHIIDHFMKVRELCKVRLHEKDEQAFIEIQELYKALS